MPFRTTHTLGRERHGDRRGTSAHVPRAQGKCVRDKVQRREQEPQEKTTQQGVDVGECDSENRQEGQWCGNDRPRVQTAP